ncbi:flavodoxin family protein [Geotalea toluenoxydans]|uniref:flavodoxin family protein n=1 Tax=Geotalea toluenoxydans TaxID=421624 RepID=UPI000B0AD477|nr:flavodoxin family protein [Geotalea toluenoxydans]
MNFIAINGSPHAQRGNTGLLLDKVVEGVQNAGGTVEMVYLSKIKVNPCVGCDACHKTGSCPIPDDFEELKKKLLACDGFILASPNYIMSVSAQMKHCSTAVAASFIARPWTASMAWWWRHPAGVAMSR